MNHFEEDVLKYAQELLTETATIEEYPTKDAPSKEFQRGKRKELFSKEQKKEIAYKYTHYNTSKRKLAKEYKCSEATIRRILKYVLKGV